LDLRRANERLGLSVTPSEAVEFLRRMRHDARADGDRISVSSPAYRLDLLHEVDLAEDLAIAWGYDRYPRGLPRHQTIGHALPENEFTDALRVLLIGYGYQEVMSLTIASAKDPVETPPRVELINPLGEDLTTLRSSLLVEGREVGRFGEIHPRILEAYSLVQPVIAFELDVGPLRPSGA